MILSFVNSKLYPVDWNGRRQLFENTNRFSSCDVMLPGFSLSCGNSKRSSVGRTIVQSHEPCDPTVSSNDEGRLKPPSFRGRQAKYGLCGQRLQTSCRGRNVGIPLAGARRLKPCPRKASACSGIQRFLTHIRIVQLYIRCRLGKNFWDVLLVHLI